MSLTWTNRKPGEFVSTDLRFTITSTICKSSTGSWKEYCLTDRHWRQDWRTPRNYRCGSVELAKGTAAAVTDPARW